MTAYITSFFLVFAGMLIGYFLWYRDRSGDEAMRESLSRDNEDLHTSLKLAHNSYAQLDDRFTRQKGQLNVLQQLCDDWSNSREQAERDRIQLEVEVADKHRRYEQSLAELQAEKQKRISLEDETHQLTQLQISKLSEMEEDWRQRHSKIESTLFQRQADLKSSSGENERIANRLHAAESRVAELQADLAMQKSLLDNATKNASGLEQEYVSLESVLKGNSDLLKTSQADCAAASSAQKVAEESLAELKNNHEIAQEQIEELQAQVTKLESSESQVESLQESLANSMQQLEKVSSQRDLALQAEKKAMALSNGLQNRIDNQEGTIHRLRAKHDDAMENLKLELTRRSELETSFDQKSVELENRLQAQLAKTVELENCLQEQTVVLEQRTSNLSAKFANEQSELQDRISMQSEVIEQLTSNREQLVTELAESAESLAQSNAELDSAKLQTREMTAKIEELKTTCLRISELEKLVQRRDQEDELVVEELRALREQHAKSYAKWQELQSEIERVNSQCQQMATDASQHDVQLEQLRSKVKASEETIRTLRRERAAVLARLANYRTIARPEATVISFTEAMQRRQEEDTLYDPEYGGHTSEHSVRGTVYTETPETQDDLKRISGIAEVLEARLNDYGIYTFKQIKEWKPEAIEEFSRLLAFKDRIVRDDWIGQASFFYEQKKSVAA